MTDTTDALVGTVGGLMAIGIMANMAGNMMNNRPARRPTYRAPKTRHAKHKIKFIK